MCRPSCCAPALRCPLLSCLPLGSRHGAGAAGCLCLPGHACLPACRCLSVAPMGRGPAPRHCHLGTLPWGLCAQGEPTAGRTPGPLPCRGHSSSSSVLLGRPLQPLAAAPRGQPPSARGTGAGSPLRSCVFPTKNQQFGFICMPRGLRAWQLGHLQHPQSLLLLLSPSRSTYITAERGREGEKKRDNGFASTLPSRAVS